MANFNTHISVAFVVSGVTALFIHKAGIISANQFLLCSILGTVGGLLPDIDLEHSVPARVGFHVLSLIMAFMMVLLFTKYMSVISLLLLWVITYGTMRWGILQLFSQLTIHRGMVHSVPYMAVIALLVVYIGFYGFQTSAMVSWFLGWFVFLGAMVHLILDELYSVNIFGLKLKKSFGTAFKFFHKKQKYSYLLLYGLLIMLCQFAPDIEDFWQIWQQPQTWQSLKQAILPQNLIFK